MKKNNKEKVASTIGGVITILLMLLASFKVAGLTDMSWWWVMSPLWLPLAFILIICAIMVVSIAVAMVIDLVED